MDINELLHNAYYASGGFADGSYLEKHARELDENYSTRKKLSYYYNFFAPIINALVDPIFKKTPQRDWQGQGAPLVEQLIEDVDKRGSDMQFFMQQVALACRLYGVCYVVVDKPQTVESRVLLEVLENKQTAYAYILTHPQIKKVEFDRFGNVAYLSYSEKGKTYIFTDEYLAVEGQTQIPNPLGKAPVIAVRSRTTSEPQPQSEFNAIAKIALNLFNTCSWLNEILKNQTFSIFLYPSLSVSNLEIGTNNALTYDGTSCPPPSFTAPPAEPANVLMSQISLQIQEMYRMAGLSFVTGSKEEASGIARAWEFERTNQSLATLARVCQTAEKQLVKLFCSWHGVDCEYECSYPMEFGVVDTQSEIQVAQMVIDLGLATGLKLDILKKVLSVYLPEMTSARFDEIIAEAEKDLADGKYDDSNITE